MFADEAKITLTVEVTVRQKDVSDIKNYLSGEHNAHTTIALLAGHSAYMVSGITTTDIKENA